MNKKALLLVVYCTVACGALYGQTITLLRDFSQGGGGLGGVSRFVLDGTDIYVTGRFFAAPYHAFLGKYGSEGQQQWLRPFLVAAAGNNRPPAELSGGLAVTPNGIYVTAAARNSRGDFNIFLRKYASDGTDLWIRELDLPTQDFADDVAADETGVYITGQIGPVGIVRKYDFAGVEQWTRNVVSDLPGRSALNAVADSSGVYVAVNRGIRKYDASGNEIWNRELAANSDVAGLTVHGDGIFAVGTQRTFTDTNPSFLRTFTLAGDPIWERRFGPDQAAGIAVDATGIYVGGTASAAVKGNCRHGTQDAVVRKFEADGAESWATQFGFFAIDSVRIMTVNNSGLYTAGRALGRVDKNPEVIDRTKLQIQNGCIVNAASLLGGGVAPGEMVTIMGTGLGPLVPAQQRLTEEGLLATRLSETSVFFDGIAAPLISVSDKQSTVIVPYEVAGRSSVSVQVEFQGARSDVTTVPVFRAKPGIFTRDGSGKGQAEAFNEDGTPNSASNPAPKGSIITFYVTGEGLIDPPVTTGSIIDTPAHRPKLHLQVQFDQGHEWVTGELISAVEKTGSPAGLLEVRARVPEWANLGDAVAFSMSLRTPLFQDPQFSAGSSGTSVAISETRIATDLAIAPAAVSPGGSFTATVSGPSFDKDTFLDVRFRSPKSNADEIGLNWQTGTSASHNVPRDTELGTWTITGIRAHSNMNDHSGEFLPVSVTVTVNPPN